jgi:hypothetical protein
MLIEKEICIRGCSVGILDRYALLAIGSDPINEYCKHHPNDYIEDSRSSIYGSDQFIR